MEIQLQLVKVGGKGRRGLFGSFLSFSFLSSKRNWTIISLLQLFIQAATFTFFFFSADLEGLYYTFFFNLIFN